MTNKQMATKGHKKSGDPSFSGPASSRKQAHAAQARAARMLSKVQGTFNRSQRKVARLRIKLNRAEARMADLAAQIDAVQATLIASSASAPAEPQAAAPTQVMPPGDGVADHVAHADQVADDTPITTGPEPVIAAQVSAVPVARSHKRRPTRSAATSVEGTNPAVEQAVEQIAAVAATAADGASTAIDQTVEHLAAVAATSDDSVGTTEVRDSRADSSVQAGPDEHTIAGGDEPHH
jgi:hypothetical protein